MAMGYFLFPLAMMLCGRIWFKERLNRLQTAAVMLACAGVAWEWLRMGAFSCALVYIVFFTDTLGLIADMPVLAGFVVLLGINSAVAMHLNLKANQLLPVAVFGMMSYLEPVLLFAVSVTFLGEPLQPGALISYGLIWSGLCMMMANGWINARQKAVDKR